MDPSGISYVLPLRRWNAEPLAELAGYLEQLPAWVEAIVVDGSDPEVFAHHAAALPSRVLHHALPGAAVTPNGKVGAVAYGVRSATYERIVVADDDVRYDAEGVRRMASRLERAGVVIPQNYFEPAPWHALWDSARSLIARAVGHDWPGTLGLRRSAFLRAGGYAGDVLFENYELVRTLAARGERIDVAHDLFVQRLPPDAARFWEQRVRQAYDEFARPLRLAVYLALAPLTLAALAFGRREVPALLAAIAIALAEFGRRRAGAHARFSPLATLFAPLWLTERALTSWIAVGRRLRCGGVRYAGVVLRKAAT